MLQKIQLKNYRNLNGVFEFAPGANILAAPNGSGKSNLVEAIYHSSTLKVFRAHTDISQVIGANAPGCEVITSLDNLELRMQISAAGSKQERKLWINDKPTQPKNFRHKFSTVLFAPHSVDLVSEDPAGRRNDLDEFISQLDPKYADQISRYEKIIKHRNALLKHIQSFDEAREQLVVWDQDLVQTAAHILRKRLEVLNQLSQKADKIAKELFPGRKFEIFYVDSVSGTDWLTDSTAKLPDLNYYASQLQAGLDQHQNKDIALGITTIGPHRDDWDARLDSDSLRYLGSRGQQRLGVLIYKVAQTQFFDKNLTEVILLLDDVFSELDMQRREFVADFLTKYGYTFLLTAVGEEEIPTNLLTKANKLIL